MKRRGWIWGFGFGAAVLFVMVQTVWAHSELTAASPAPGALLATPPAEIRLFFDEELIEGSTLAIFDDAFRQIKVPVAVDTDQPTQLVSVSPNLADGIYTIQWLSVNVDGHSLSGSYNFTIGESVGERQMLEAVAFAESAAVNPPGWVAWLIVILALGLPIATRIWLGRRG